MNLKRFVFGLVVATSGLLGMTSAQGDDGSAVYKKSVRSAVFIVAKEKQGFSMGSGSLIDVEQKLILTNDHVAGEHKFVYVQFPLFDAKGKMITDKEVYLDNIGKNKALIADLVCTSQKRDLAIVKIRGNIPPGTAALPFVKQEVSSGMSVWNIGSPGAVEHIFGITSGEVRTVGTKKWLAGNSAADAKEYEARMITATNPTNGGDSGGPLLNKNGELVGVTQGGSRTADRVNIFVNISEVRDMLKENKITIKGGKTPDEVVVAKDPKEDTTEPKTDTPPKAGNKEAEAQNELRKAKLFAGNNSLQEEYVSKLQLIVKKYPETDAAKEAMKMLNAAKRK